MWMLFFTVWPTFETFEKKSCFSAFFIQWDLYLILRYQNPAKDVQGSGEGLSNDGAGLFPLPSPLFQLLQKYFRLAINAKYTDECLALTPDVVVGGLGYISGPWTFGYIRASTIPVINCIISLCNAQGDG